MPPDSCLEIPGLDRRCARRSDKADQAAGLRQHQQGKTAGLRRGITPALLHRSGSPPIPENFFLVYGVLLSALWIIDEEEGCDRPAAIVGAPDLAELPARRLGNLARRVIAYMAAIMRLSASPTCCVVCPATRSTASRNSCPSAGSPPNYRLPYHRSNAPATTGTSGRLRVEGIGNAAVARLCQSLRGRAQS